MSVMRIGTWTLPHPVCVAPMAGVTDRPYRRLCKALGAAYAVSEMAASNPRLWDSVKTSRRLDHTGEPDPVAVQIAGADPDMLAEYARASLGRQVTSQYAAEDGRLHAAHIFSGAEVLDPLDRAAIEGATVRRVREIYMATEGLFGVACPHGTLHLAEDAVHFEWEDGPDGLVAPVVTDFTRRTQAMARYRMNDLLQLDDRLCPCGSALQPVRRIEGRQDDVFLCPDAGGTLRPVTPDVLRNAVVDADPRIDDFRIAQLGPSTIEVRLAADLPPEVDAAVRANLARLAAGMNLAPLDIAVAHGIAVPFDRKLRRVERRWRPD